MPPSARTVRCATRGGPPSACPPARRSRGCPPTPTPAIGRSANASSVTVTRRERPLVASRVERPSIAWAAKAAAPTATTAAQTSRRTRSPAGPVQRDRERHREECDEARLRVREVEAPEEERDDGCRGHPVDRAPLADEDDNEQNGDRDDEVAAVQARVLEERGDAEERGVGVRDLDVAGEEHRARLRLPEPDGREERAERHERQEQRPREPGRERRPAGDGERGGEREQEERERDASVPLVPRPQERERRERDEGGQRKGEEEGRRRGRSPRTTRYASARAADVSTRRQEEERILLTDLDGYPEGRGGEEDDRDDRRVAREGSPRAPRRARPFPGARRLRARRRCAPRRHLPRAIARALPSRRREGRSPRSKAVARHEREHRAERPEDGGDLGGVRVLHRSERYALAVLVE